MKQESVVVRGKRCPVTVTRRDGGPFPVVMGGETVQAAWETRTQGPGYGESVVVTVWQETSPEERAAGRAAIARAAARMVGEGVTKGRKAP